MARLTPVITATSVFPFASRTALVRHEPPGRSTNRMAGLSSIARASRSASAPESQPSLLTATSASLTPVIAATAARSASATAACETITPRVASLIVLLEVLQHLAPLGHAVEQRRLVPPAERHVVAVAGDVHDVVRDQPVAALDQVEHAFALADPRAPEEQESHAEHVRQRAVHGRGRGERVVEERLQAPVELGGLELGADDGHALGARQLQQLGGHLLPLRDHDARDIELKERLERLAALVRAE